jgi:Zn-dependent peptidase ImmA (M78 family)
MRICIRDRQGLVMLPEIPLEELAATLDAAAARLVATAGIRKPPVDALVVAHALGIAVATDDRQPGRARYVRLAGFAGAAPRPSILLRSEPRVERRQWAVAHEIGEQAAHLVFSRLGVDPRVAPPAARETVANHLAVRLLLPRAWFFPDAIECAWDVLALKQRYATASHELLARRMLDYSLPVMISVYDRGGLSFRRGNAAGRVSPPSPLERACCSAAHASGLPHDDRDALQSVQAWPIHEPDWKREIVRVEWVQDGSADVG